MQSQISRCLRHFVDLPLGSVLVESCLGTHLGLFQAHSSPAETATNCGSCYSSKNIIQGQPRVVFYVELHTSPFQEASDPIYLVVHFRTTFQHNPIRSKSGTGKGILAGSRSCLGQFHFMRSAPVHQLIHCGQGSFSESASLS